MTSRLKQRIFTILEESNPDDLTSRLDDIFFCILIPIDVGAFILQTSETLSAQYGYLFEAIGIFAVTVFTIEYVLRLWICTVDPRFEHPLWGRIRYVITPMALIDLLAILPFYVLLIFTNIGFIASTRIFRLIRIFRLFRLFKMGRYSESLKTLGRAIKAQREELVLTFVMVLMLLILASSLMFFAESEAQPEVFPSIPAAMWWGVVTLTTVGYGDIYPITPMGKFLGALLAFLGIGMFALPAGIVASSFIEEVERKGSQTVEESQPEAAIAQLWTPEQKREITAKVEQNAKLFKECLQTAKEEFGELVESEESIHSMAMFLYLQVLKDGNIINSSNPQFK
ncbi:MAG: ion transporter [Xenococcaceae cyanobacterium]